MGQRIAGSTESRLTLETTLKRRIGLGLLTAYGIGVIVGAGLLAAIAALVTAFGDVL